MPDLTNIQNLNGEILQSIRIQFWLRLYNSNHLWRQYLLKSSEDPADVRLSPKSIFHMILFNPDSDNLDSEVSDIDPDDEIGERFSTKSVDSFSLHPRTTKGAGINKRTSPASWTMENPNDSRDTEKCKVD
ncbi:hypothetical protein TNIN_490001 [Trichonephila inaurata madagascariensis]|uniref:Uncharacterized protein n=1 Tax=Trichonephila inaurata madagascariensis TaxID=2747483 RepID=A0A8X6XBV6_9ARAC|nr:hypothetical protein TNIN_490001 [Trichonephila inaurata madagascariensis]